MPPDRLKSKIRVEIELYRYVCILYMYRYIRHIIHIYFFED